MVEPKLGGHLEPLLSKGEFKFVSFVKGVRQDKKREEKRQGRECLPSLPFFLFSICCLPQPTQPNARHLARLKESLGSLPFPSGPPAKQEPLLLLPSSHSNHSHLFPRTEENKETLSSLSKTRAIVWRGRPAASSLLFPRRGRSQKAGMN